MPSPHDRQAEPVGSRTDHQSRNDRDPDTSRLRKGLPGDGRRALRAGVARMEGVVRQTIGDDTGCGSLSGGGERPPGSGRADGGAFGQARSATSSDGPDFATPVTGNGYAWWYVDGLSDDGADGLTIIGFVGSVFSPYYARARRRADDVARPEDHAAVNVAIYGRTRRWSMTERGRAALRRDTNSLQVGPSSMSWRSGELIIDIDEIGVPIPVRLTGRVRLIPEATVARVFAIDGKGDHMWRPIAPRAHIEVEFERPDMRWSGHAYFDHNIGCEPLERCFRGWHWSRAATPDGSLVIYDTDLRDPARVVPALGLDISRTGDVTDFALPPRADLGMTKWRIGRTARCDAGSRASVLRTLEDTPFYARSLIQTRVDGQAVSAFHESLDLDRFRMPLVQAMLPFRMPRRAKWPS